MINQHFRSTVKTIKVAGQKFELRLLINSGKRRGKKLNIIKEKQGVHKSISLLAVDMLENGLFKFIDISKNDAWRVTGISRHIGLKLN
ncbi:hypothetical protein [Legionella clemsonensis]|uniref:Uncharacterized protein n=1 Tax=Legionella clemsonensis TaxID=1867846 RepID=A0A222P004_9GAMM|nr:hypothetical protein [Legionella clemsonensis]ASQ45159.1 hypothetical protein clem_03005 [Legionella clemsonensis]